jgi:hypothetical protein
MREKNGRGTKFVRTGHVELEHTWLTSLVHADHVEVEHT